MEERTGEKIGWLLGWMGGFIWALILSLVWLAKGRLPQAGVGLLVFAVAVGLIVLAAPWRHPEIQYWKLMLPVYAMFALTLFWAVWSAGGLAQLGLQRWSGAWVLPALLPFATVGRRRWKDHGDRGRPEDP